MRCSVDEAGRIVEDRNSGIVCMRIPRCSVEEVGRIVEDRKPEMRREETRKAEKARRVETERDENIREESGVGEEVDQKNSGDPCITVVLANIKRNSLLSESDRGRFSPDISIAA